MSFSVRSYQKELLDQPGIPWIDIQRNMQELNTINTYLGGHSITLNGFKQLAKNNTSLTVCEIGCGGGDNLKAIDQWCKKKNIQFQLIGIDLNEHCIRVAKEALPGSNTRFITADYSTVSFSENKPDIIFSSLFCHHFTDEQLIQLLQWIQQNCKLGFFINDLHRHWLAYYSIKYLTRAFSKSYLIKNDAPLSVQRGFIKREWQYLLQQAAIHQFHIQWKWAFRWLIICNKIS
jgi:2-polyprenyl-3-methyl-5-hydroxy-6-metoxy-1,4-benzoquinol methylase